MEEKVALDLVTIVMNTCEKDVLQDRCLKALSKLSSINVNKKFILTSKIGQMISSLESNPHRKQVIREAASRVLTSWRRQLYHHPSPSNLHPQIADQKTKKPLEIQSANLKSSNKLKVSRANSLPQPKYSPRQVVVKSDVNSTRDHISQQIFEALNMGLKESQSQGINIDPIGLSMSIESILYESWGIFSNSTNKYRSLLYNLKDAKNPDFRRKILTGELKAEKIAILKTEDMASNQKRRQIENIREAALTKCIVGRNAL